MSIPTVGLLVLYPLQSFVGITEIEMPMLSAVRKERNFNEL